MKLSLWLAVLGLFLAACDTQDTGPVKINYDRDICDYCKMIISDRFHAAQIRQPVTKEVYKFDDIGGAITWLKDQPYKDNPQLEVWVTDYKTSKWLDATKAWYVVGRITPMAFGFSAQENQTPDTIDYKTMVSRVLEKKHLGH